MIEIINPTKLINQTILCAIIGVIIGIGAAASYIILEAISGENKNKGTIL